MRILRWLALALAPLALWATPAAAQYVVRDGNGVERTFCSFTVLGVHYGCQVLHGSNAGVPQALAVDGSGRPTVLQGGSWSVGLTGTLPAFASAPTVDLGSLNGAATAANQATLNGHVDGVEGLIGSTNTKLDTLDGRVDGIEALITTLNAKVDTVITNTDRTADAAEDTTAVAVTLPTTPTANLASIDTKSGETHGTTGAAVPTKAGLAGARSGANLVELIQANAQAAVNVSTATTSQIVAQSGSTKIYVTYAHVESAGTTTFKFVYGTGTNCGTGTTDLHPAFAWTAQDGFSGGSGLGPILVVPAGNALCVTNSAAVQVSGWIAYTQF
jgi:hypothetical protein